MKNDIKIAIVGDSWGTPYLEDELREGYTFLGHSQQLFRDLGYSVMNFSRRGCSNYLPFQLYSEVEFAANYTVWFHTELSRDIPFKFKPPYTWKIDKALKEISQDIYPLAKRILDEKNTKLILVEGQAPLWDPKKTLKLLEPWKFIPDWRSALIGQQMPYTHMVSNYKMLEWKECRDGKQRRLEEAGACLKILEAMKQSKLFPDDAHPGDAAHKQLVETIHNWIREDLQNQN